MQSPNWTQADTRKAKQIWAEYQEGHNLSDRIGQTVGIDPKSRNVWFGESIRDIVMQRSSQGLDSPLFFERIGSDTCFRKGRYRFLDPVRVDWTDRSTTMKTGKPTV